MNPKLKGFFATATAAADATAAEQKAADEAAALQQARLESNMQLLNGMVREEIGPIIDALKALPAKDEKVFDVNVSEWGYKDTATTHITITYARPDADFSRCTGVWVTPEEHPRVKLEIKRDGAGKMDFTCIQYALVERKPDSKPYFRITSPKDFEDARVELAFAFGRFAADRVPDIGAALEAASAPEAIPVFRKPLNLKNPTI
jgi:hypothetical protein